MTKIIDLINDVEEWQYGKIRYHSDIDCWELIWGNGKILVPNSEWERGKKRGDIIDRWRKNVKN